MRSERKNIIQPSDWWAAFESEAASKGVSLSEWVGAACRKALPKDARGKLSERVGRGRPSNMENR